MSSSPSAESVSPNVACIAWARASRVARWSWTRSMTSAMDSSTMYLVPSMSVRMVSGAESMRCSRSGFTPNRGPFKRVTTITAVSVPGADLRARPWALQSSDRPVPLRREVSGRGDPQEQRAQGLDLGGLEPARDDRLRDATGHRLGQRGAAGAGQGDDRPALVAGVPGAVDVTR